MHKRSYALVPVGVLRLDAGGTLANSEMAPAPDSLQSDIRLRPRFEDMVQVVLDNLVSLALPCVF